MMLERLVRVAGFMNSFEAHLAAQHLRNHGVPALVGDDSTGFSHFQALFMPRACNVEVRVRPQDVEEALRILDTVEEWIEEDTVDEDELAAEYPEEEEEEEVEAVCDACGATEQVCRKRWWPGMLALLTAPLATIAPTAAVMLVVLFLGLFLALPPRCLCARCGSRVNEQR